MPEAVTTYLPKALYLLDGEAFQKIYGEEEQEAAVAGPAGVYASPNVVLTPHIAGSLGSECRRMGRLVVDELRRYVAGESLEHEIIREQAALMA